MDLWKIDTLFWIIGLVFGEKVDYGRIAKDNVALFICCSNKKLRWYSPCVK